MTSKKQPEVRYPNSVSLFKFCRRVLDHKYGGIRVIDQDIGQILGFDPADCSHWKKGKKNIRSIQAVKSIADHLGVDEKLVVDVAAGDLDAAEAYHEFAGYGAFSLDQRIYDAAKKQYYKKFSANWSKEKEEEFRSLYTADPYSIEREVERIHQKIGFAEAPLYLPEVATGFPDIQLKQVPSAGREEDDLLSLSSKFEGGKLAISFTQGAEMRPYVRYQIAKAMCPYFLKPKKVPAVLADFSAHIQEIEGNIFASFLLAPTHLVRKEMSQLRPHRDLVSQLAETFWVSKSFINRRLQDIIRG